MVESHLLRHHGYIIYDPLDSLNILRHYLFLEGFFSMIQCLLHKEYVIHKGNLMVATLSLNFNKRDLIQATLAYRNKAENLCRVA